LLTALQVLHDRRILHRDIKPQNILLDERSGEPILTDFGLARLLGEAGMTSTGIFLGTPQYASPEQAKLLPLDERSDLYSMGLVMFEMATGARPFVTDGLRNVLDMHRSEPAPAPIKVDASVPNQFSNIILKCLEKEPSRRYDSADKLHAAVEACKS
jgi:serine/threonine protein kinase